MDYRAEITKLRRFSLAIGLILFVYSVAGVQLDSPAKISPLGIPLIINRPELLGTGLVLASLYGMVRYFQYAMVFAMSPFKTRRLLKNGILSLVHCNKIAEAFGEGDDTCEPRYIRNLYSLGPDDIYVNSVKRVVRSLAARFYPGVSGYCVDLSKYDGIILYVDKDQYNFKTRLLNIWENVDYSIPLWVNGIALFTFFITLM